VPILLQKSHFCNKICQNLIGASGALSAALIFA
jgi:hypothetical protein